MNELVPVILGTLFGAIIWRRTRGQIRLAPSACTVVVSGASATVLSGEFLHSWIYVPIDLGDTMLGLALGLAMARRMLPSRRARGRAF